MRRCILLLTLVLATSGVACAETGFWSGGKTWAIAISPARPTSADEVYVTVSGVVASSAHYIEITDVHTEGNNIWLSAAMRNPASGIQGCLVHCWSEATASLGQLCPGIYTVYVGDHATSTYDDSLSFTVMHAVPDVLNDDTQTHTEGLSDCICRRWPALFAGRPCPFCGRDPSDSASSGGAGSLLDDLRQRIGTLWQK